MLISFALGKSDNAGARRFLEQKDVFNVSITRAKEQQVVFHSVELGDLPSGSLLAEYLNSVKNSGNEEIREDDLPKQADLFAEQVIQQCAQNGIKASLYESVASIPVDILLEKNGKYLGVDLIGYPGHTRESIGIVKQQILDRVGIKLVPVGFVEWQVKSKEIMMKIINSF